MGYGRRKLEIKKQNSTFGLNITSMTDMFTILLVFLLQTYATSEVQITPEQGMRLPSSSSEANPIKSVQLSLSNKELKLDGKTLATLNSDDFAKSDIDSNDSNFVLPLFKELQRISKENEAKGEQQAKDITEGLILIQADQSLPYQMLRKVMYTASMAGFPKVKLATVMGE
jgi:biopolymer transport protein ExbD